MFFGFNVAIKLTDTSIIVNSEARFSELVVVRHHLITFDIAISFLVPFHFICIHNYR
jgi:hypothetical protein